MKSNLTGSDSESAAELVKCHDSYLKKQREIFVELMGENEVTQESFSKVRIMFDPFSTEAIIAALSAAGSYYRDQDYASYQKDINSKLEEVHKNTQTILDELKQLGVKMEQIVEDKFREYAIRQLNAQRNSINDCLAEIAGPNPRDLQTELTERFNTVKDIMYLLMEYGAVSYQAVSSAWSLTISLSPHIRVPATHLMNARQHVLNWYSELERVDAQGSFGNWIAKRTNEENDLLNKLRTFPKQGYLGSGSYFINSRIDPGERDRSRKVYINYYLKLTGSPPVSPGLSLGFRFNTKGPEEVIEPPGKHENDRAWYKYASIVKNINENIGHMDGASDEAGKVIHFTSQIASNRDLVSSNRLNLIAYLSAARRIRSEIEKQIFP